MNPSVGAGAEYLHRDESMEGSDGGADVPKWTLGQCDAYVIDFLKRQF